MSYDDVIQFWFEELEAEQWWRRDDQLDRRITRRFELLHAAAARCELYEWRRSSPGRAAEIIVLDQFSRNIHRDTAAAFACDSMALCLAQEAVRDGLDGLSQQQRLFCYMPFMHSESRKIHEIAVALFTALGLADNLEHELEHKAIIDRFGRYPHRNRILGRQSTPQEIAFLQEPDSSF